MAIQRVRLHDNKVRVLSMFLTVDGECNSFGPGVWSVFIRTVGCDVKCSWCDTKYSWGWNQGTDMDIDSIVARAAVLARRLPLKKITITGGEPLQQWHNGLRKLVDRLLLLGWKISIETSGCVRIPTELKDATNVCLVVDYKLPSSNVAMQPVPANFDQSLGAQHYIKFVITDEHDFYAALTWVDVFRKEGCLAQMYFSPSFKDVTPKELFTWMKTNELCKSLGVRMNMQMHKFIFAGSWREEEQESVE